MCIRDRATYQVPIEVPENRRLALAMRWIISFARSRKGNSMVDRLTAELIAASKNEGSSIKKKEDLCTKIVPIIIRFCWCQND